MASVTFQNDILATPPAGTKVEVEVQADGSDRQVVKIADSALPLGAATEATLANVLTTSDFDTKVGSLTETAPATDTASSGLNGRLQRIAQRITSLIALLPSALGAGGGLKVDGSGTALPVSGTVTANAGTNLNTSLLALEAGNLATLAGAVSSSKMAVKSASGDFADGAQVTLGAKADAKSTATDTTSVSAMSVWKQISASAQAIATSVAGTLTVASHAVTNAGTFAVQAAITAASGSIASGAIASGAVASGAFASGAIADGAQVTLGAKADAKSSATDTTSITAMQVLKQISFSIQAAAASLAGTLTVASHAVTNAGTFAVQATLQAGTALIGQVAASNETGTVYNGTTAITPKFATIAASSSGNNTIVAAVNPKKIRVVAVNLIANAAVNAKWQSGASGTDLTGLAYLAANGGYVLPYNPLGYFETASNTLLNLNLSGAVAVGGHITYLEV